MKILITNPGDPVKRGSLYECSIWIELDGNTCVIKKNTNYPIDKDSPRTFPLDELPQFLREEKILQECRPELPEIKYTLDEVASQKLKGRKLWQQKKINP